MLKFNPNNQISLTPSNDSKLEGSFVVSNPTSNTSAPYKVKCTHPDSYTVHPSQGVLGPLNQVKVKVATVEAHSQDLSRQITQHHRFQIEYTMLPTPPSDISQALSSITRDSKLTHKYYLSAEDLGFRDDRSAVSDTPSFRSTSNAPPAQPYHDMNHDQKFSHLSNAIDGLEEQRSRLSQPRKKGVNIVLLVVLFVVGLVLGNLIGKAAGLGQSAHEVQQQREYGWLGLERYWAGEEKQPEKEGGWW